MPSSEIALLEQRIAQLEEQVGIAGSKTLQQQAEEETEATSNASAHAFRAKYAVREFGSDKKMEKALNTSIVVLLNKLEEDNVQSILPQMEQMLGTHLDHIFRTALRRRNESLRDGGLALEGVQTTWGFWEKDDPIFELTDDEVAEYTGGGVLPVIRLPNREPNSSDSTFIALDDTWTSKFTSWLDDFAPVR